MAFVICLIFSLIALVSVGHSFLAINARISSATWIFTSTGNSFIIVIVSLRMPDSSYDTEAGPDFGPELAFNRPTFGILSWLSEILDSDAPLDFPASMDAVTLR